MWQMCHQMTEGRSVLTVSWWSISVLLCNHAICTSRRKISQCTFDRVCFISVCVHTSGKMRVLHQARPPSGPLFTLPHTTQWDHSRFACKTWYKHNYTVMNASTKTPPGAEKSPRSRPAWRKCLQFHSHICTLCCRSYKNPTENSFYLNVFQCISFRSVWSFSKTLTHFEGLQVSSVASVSNLHVKQINSN